MSDRATRAPVLPQPGSLSPTLEAVAEASGYLRWLSGLVTSHLEPPVLEIGAGIGAFSEALSELIGPLLVSEPDEELLFCLEERLGRRPGITVVDPIMLPVEWTPQAADLGPRSIMLCNVLEHIDEEREALRSLLAAFPSVDRLVLIVPAHGWAYTRMDAGLGHHRRYSAGSLRQQLRDSGWSPVQVRYVNPIGAFIWAVSGRLFRRSAIRPWHSRAVDLLLPLLRAADTALGGRWVGQSLIAVADRPTS